MLVPEPIVAAQKSDPGRKVPAAARLLPSLTDIAFLMPLVFVFVKLAGARTLLGDGDTGWHVRTGEWILSHGRVPYADFFSFTRPGAPWYAWEWLWDVCFALLHRRWGMAAVVAVSMAIICLTSAVLFRLIRRTCGNSLVAIAVTLLATGGCAIHWLARPHLLTLLFFTLTLHIVMRAAEGRTRLLAWLVPLTLVWTNLHGGFFVVFLVLGCYIGAALLKALLADGPGARRGHLRSVLPWLQAFAACFAVTFANPYGWELHRHVIQYITDPYQLQHITEFQSMNFHSPVVVYFEPLMFLALATALWDARNGRYADVLLSLGWLHLALIAQRNIPLFAIAAAPFVARGMVAAVREASSSPASLLRAAAARFTACSADFEANDRIGRVYLASFLPLAAVSAVLLITPPAAGALDTKFVSTYDPRSYPERALPELLADETHHIFAEDEWGDYLIYHLYPRKKVFVDGRSDFYGDEFGERYLDILNVQHGWQKTLDRYGVDTIVIAPKFALASTLKISRDWRIVYDDGVALVFRRNAPASDSLVTSNGGNSRDRAIAKSNEGDRTVTQPTT